jgi:multicomponent Na+:H+ antiporter subunit B
LKTNDIILQTVTKIVTFIIITFSIHLFFAGHYYPGGGFIGGLMTASAIVLILLAFDFKTVKHVIPVDYKKMIAVGLLLAVGTGIISIFANTPFLTHFHGYFDLPLMGKTGLTTASLFDLGVYFVVVGITITIIQSIGENE